VLIVGARMHVEGQGKTAMMSQDWRIVLDCWVKSGHVTDLGDAAEKRATPTGS